MQDQLDIIPEGPCHGLAVEWVEAHQRLPQQLQEQLTDSGAGGRPLAASCCSGLLP